MSTQKSANAGTSGLRTSRFGLVSVLSLSVAVISVIPAVAAGIDLLTVIEFATLEFALGLISFRWWYQPLYRTAYNYFSPLAILGILGYLYGGPGNALAFAYRDEMSWGNQGVWGFFFVPMFAADLGMLVFDWAYRGMSRLLKPQPAYPLPAIDRVLDNRAAFRTQAILWLFTVVAINFYLGSKYTLMVQSFIVGSDLDNVLYQSRPVLIMTAWAGVSILIGTSRTLAGKALGILLFAPLAPYLVTMLSRQTCIYAFVCTLFVLMAVKRTADGLPIRTTVTLACAAAAAFIAITNFRSSLAYEKLAVTNSTGSVAEEIFSNPLNFQNTGEYLKMYNQNRIAGLDFPSAIEASHRSGNVPWMYGYHNWLVVARMVPRFLWPDKPDVDPEVAINRHFGLGDIDQVTVPFSSGYADGGIAGVAIGLSVLGASLCLMQHWVWKLKSGFLLYMGSLAVLLNFEVYALTDPLQWLRCLAVMLAIDVAVRVVTKPLRAIARPAAAPARPGAPALRPIACRFPLDRRLVLKQSPDSVECTR